MNILVCVKQVPAVSKVKIDRTTGNLIREGVPTIINPADQAALEAALEIKETMGADITVIAMGSPSAETGLKKCIAYGADRAFLASDRAFAGADTLATSFALFKLANKVGKKFDLILTGNQTLDGDTGQIGPQLAERLNVPQITFVNEFKVENNEVTAVRTSGNETYEVKCALPVLLTITRQAKPLRKGAPNEEELMNKAEVTVYSADDIGADKDKIGKSGSPTIVENTFPPDEPEKGVIIDEKTAAASVKKLMEILNEKNLIK